MGDGGDWTGDVSSSRTSCASSCDIRPRRRLGRRLMTSLLTSSTGGAAAAGGGGCGFEAAPVKTGHVNDLTSVQEAAQQIAYTCITIF